MALSILAWDWVGGGGIVKVVMVGWEVVEEGRMVFDGFGVALLHSNLPRGKLSL
jgi:hypothetical protein